MPISKNLQAINEAINIQGDAKNEPQITAANGATVKGDSDLTTKKYVDAGDKKLEDKIDELEPLSQNLKALILVPGQKKG